VAWSKDNIIAVAGGEQIAILSPRLKDSGPDDLHWDDCLIKVNAYTISENPVLDPLSSAHFSVGEELSIRHVLSLQWSSPGFGQNGRCVLAVLTTDHVLSIWECEGRPSVSTCWKRRLIVNHAISKHYERTGTARSASGQDAHMQFGRKRVQQRIRAFTWSPPLYKDWAGDRVTPFLSRGHHFLAVSTESGDVLLVGVQPPYDVLRPEVATWSAEVIHNLELGGQTGGAMNADGSSATPESYSRNDESVVADYLAWGPWRWDADIDEGNVATLAYVANGRLLTTELLGDIYKSPPEARKVNGSAQKHHLTSRADITGPLQFCHPNKTLVTFSSDKVYMVSLLE